MSFHPSEELKEALLKAKGRPIAIIMQIKNGEWAIEPTAYTIKTQKGKEVILEELRPLEEPTEAKKSIIQDIINNLKTTLKTNIETAVEKALEQKSIEQLLIIQKEAPQARLEHKRGCFWLVTPNEEVCL